MKVNPEHALKACRFQFLKMVENNRLLCEALNIAEAAMDCGCIFHTANGEGCPSVEAMRKIKELKDKLT